MEDVLKGVPCTGCIGSGAMCAVSYSGEEAMLFQNQVLVKRHIRADSSDRMLHPTGFSQLIFANALTGISASKETIPPSGSGF